MNILRCHIMGFGKLADLDIAFCPRLNLVFAPNEGGKSTLQYYLLALLYGQLRDDVPHQRRLEVWVEQFKPWRIADYGGRLWCKLAGGGELEILRTFGKDESRIEIRTGTGEDITAKYERRKNGDVLLARSHLGMPKDLFESVAVVRENRAGDFHGPENIRDRIANLAQTGDEALSIGLSFKKLEDALEELGSERAPTRPYRLAQDRLQMLQKERKELEERWIEFQGWVQERNAYAENLARLEQEARGARQRVTAARLKESAQKVVALEKMEAELHVLRQEIAAGVEYATFPADFLEELNGLVLGRNAHEQRLHEVRGALVQAEEEIRTIGDKRQVVAIYESLDSEKEPDSVAEWRILHESLSGQIRDVDQGVTHMRAECAALTEELKKLGPAFHDSEVDWPKKVQEANEAERAANQKNMALAEELSRENDTLVSERSAIIRGRTWGAANLILSLVFAGGALILLDARFVPMSFCYAIALTLGAWSFVLFRAASGSKSSVSLILSEIDRMKVEQEHLKEEGQKVHFEIGVASASSGFRDVKDFLAAAERAEDIRHRLESLQERIAESRQLRERLVSESADLFRNIQAALEKVGIECSVDDLEGRVNLLRDNLRHFRMLDAEYRNCGQKAGSLREEEARFQEEWNRADLRIREILTESRQESPEAFREACRKHQLLAVLKDKEASLLREYEARGENRTLEEWEKRLDSLNAQLQDETPARLEPLSGEEAERMEREISALIASARADHARLVGSISQAFRNSRTASEIDEDIALAEAALKQISRNRDALAIALEALEDLSRRQQEDLAPQLNHAVEQRFLRLCHGRYEEIKIDPDFHVWVRESGSGELRSSDSLSRGTQDQLYFALRFGILDLVSNGAEPCPCFLDEPFSAYDRVRLEEAFHILEEEAQRRQLILFTCRDDLLDLAFSHQAHLIQLA